VETPSRFPPAGGTVGGLPVLVGSLAFLAAKPHPALLAEAEAHTRRGETVAWAGWEGRVAGLIALRDEPQPTAATALRRLAGLGIEAVMLSGDDPRTARAIAAELGLAEYEGRCAPADKAARIQAWQKAGKRVAVVGDGVNDAPALAQADISITAAGGTDVAGAVSDVVLTSHDLALLPELVELSRRTRRTIGLNLARALVYNLVTVPLAALGAISPAVAAATMAASSLLVVDNSLRLRARSSASWQ